MVYEEPAPPVAPQVFRLPLAPVRSVYAIIVLNIAAFIPYLGTLIGMREVWYLTLGMGGLFPAAVYEGNELWRLVTAGFLHGDLLHIGFNMYAINIVGRNAEQLFGTGRFLWGYMLSLLSSSVLVTAFAGSETLTIGASGAIMGVVGMLIVYSYTYRDMPAVNRMFGSLVRMALLNLGIGLLPGISLWGHLGGLLGGLAAGWALCPRYAVIAGNEWSPGQINLQAWGERESIRLGLVIAGLVAVTLGTLWLR